MMSIPHNIIMDLNNVMTNFPGLVNASTIVVVFDVFHADLALKGQNYPSNGPSHGVVENILILNC